MELRVTESTETNGVDVGHGSLVVYHNSIHPYRPIRLRNSKSAAALDSSAVYHRKTHLRFHRYPPRWPAKLTLIHASETDLAPLHLISRQMYRENRGSELPLHHQVLKERRLAAAGDRAEGHTDKPVVRRGVEVFGFLVDCTEGLFLNSEAADGDDVSGECTRGLAGSLYMFRRRLVSNFIRLRDECEDLHRLSRTLRCYSHTLNSWT